MSASPGTAACPASPAARPPAPTRSNATAACSWTPQASKSSSRGPGGRASTPSKTTHPTRERCSERLRHARAHAAGSRRGPHPPGHHRRADHSQRGRHAGERSDRRTRSRRSGRHGQRRPRERQRRHGHHGRPSRSFCRPSNRVGRHHEMAAAEIERVHDLVGLVDLLRRERSMADQVHFHVSLNVAHLERSVDFFRMLFGVEPAKHRPDYAKFETSAPPLVLRCRSVWSEVVCARRGKKGSSAATRNRRSSGSTIPMAPCGRCTPSMETSSIAALDSQSERSTGRRATGPLLQQSGNTRCSLRSRSASPWWITRPTRCDSAARSMRRATT